MAERFIFFNSAPGDPRTYQASNFADYFGDVLSSGLLHTNENPALKVKVEGGTLRTYVEPGKAIMQGYGYENTSPLYLEHALPEATLDRIDRVVLRLDKRNQSRFIKLFVKQGETGEDPVPPSLQRDEFIYELSLAQMIVRANTASLDPFELTDERLNEEVCGLVHSLITIPTAQFQEQWDLYFNNKKDELDAEGQAFEQELAQKIISYETYFDSKRNQLDGETQQFENDLAQNLIRYETEFNDWFLDLQETGFASYSDLANLQIEFSEHQAEYEQFKQSKGQPNGLAALDNHGKLVGSQIPLLDYIPSSEKGKSHGVATLDKNGYLVQKQVGDGVLSGPTTNLTYLHLMGVL